MPRVDVDKVAMIEYLQKEKGCPSSLNITQVAKHFKKSRQWVYNAISMGALKRNNIGEVPVGSIADYELGRR